MHQRLSQRLIQLGLMAAAMFAFVAGNSPARAVEISEATIKARVIANVNTSLQTLIAKSDLTDVQVNIIRIPTAPFEFPAAASEAAVKITMASPLSTMYSQRSIVRVHMQDEKGETRDIGVPVQITILKPVWVVKNAINANSPLRPSDLKLEMRDVSYNYGYAVGQEHDINDYATRVSLRPGEILDNRKIIIPPDVHCNNEVSIVMTNDNGMMLSIPGIALADGRVGDTIRVRQSLYQRKYYAAKVISKNQVQVQI